MQEQPKKSEYYSIASIILLLEGLEKPKETVDEIQSWINLHGQWLLLRAIWPKLSEKTKEAIIDIFKSAD